jgi:hypothetical protein
MVGVLVRLRLALAARGRGSGTVARLWRGGTWVLGLLLGGLVGAGVALLLVQDPGGYAAPSLTMLALVVGFSWVAIPILVPALANQAIDPARLDPYPLAPRTQVVGLLAGALVAPTVLGLLLGGLGGAVGVALAGGGVLAAAGAVGAALVLVGLCVAASGAVQAFLASALSSRRGRDVVLLLSGGVALLGALVGEVAPRAAGFAGAFADGPLATALSWIPPGSLGASMASFADGQVGAALARVGTGLLGTALAIGWWVRVIAGRPSTAGRASAAPRSTGIEQALGPWPLTVLGHSRFAAALYQQWRYMFFRSAAALRYLVVPLVAFLPLLLLRGADLPLVLVAGVLGIAASTGASYAFDFDDRGFEFLMMTGAPWRPVLLGKALSFTILGLPVLVGFWVALALVFDRRDELAAGMTLALALTLMGLGLGAAASVRNPSNKAQRRQQRGARLAVQLLVVAIPLLVAGALFWLRGELAPGISDLALAVALLPLGAAVAWTGVELGARWLTRDPWRTHALLEH